ncbi:hypothetical protein PT974_09671 [Cladobotryum mycophilum]|uniref:Translation elongation factor P/YeiP central domain-containing protein n=1 Tax=Cladobotryum mycophilum TaxID=491253 RepID=A0ABR0SGX8_9HYPO
MVEIETKKARYHHHTDTDDFVFFDSQTDDQIIISLDTLGISKSLYLADSTEVTVTLHDGDPVSVKIPSTITSKVSALKKVGYSTLFAVIESGAILVVPDSVGESDDIVVDTKTGRFVMKA